MALGFWAGVQQYDVEGKAAKKARQDRLDAQLTRTTLCILKNFVSNI